MAKPSTTLLKAVAVTAELMGSELSGDAAAVMASDLAEYPEPQILAALVRCRRESRGRLTIADVISRLDDGRLGPNEAWALVPKSEDESVVWTDEIAHAFFAAKSLLEIGDEIAARMAFIETYQRELMSARSEHRAPRWWASLGHNREGREKAIRVAIERGRLSEAAGERLLPAAPGDRAGGMVDFKTAREKLR